MSQKNRKITGVYLLNCQKYNVAIIILYFITIINITYGAEINNKIVNNTVKLIKFSPRLNDTDSFQPIKINKNNQNNNFTNNNNYINNNNIFNSSNNKNTQNYFNKNINNKLNNENIIKINNNKNSIVYFDDKINNKKLNKKLKNIKNEENKILNNLDKLLNKRSYEIISGINLELNELHNITSNSQNLNSGPLLSSSPKSFPKTELTLNEKIFERLKTFAETHYINVNVPRAAETGRLLFFKGLKKLFWPIMIGVQVIKTVLLTLFLPSILGSIGKIVSKGLSQGLASSISGAVQPQDTIQDFEFKDNTYNAEPDKYNDYTYPQGESSNTNFATQMYDAATINNAYSKYGMNDQKSTYMTSMNSINGDLATMGTGTMTMKKDDFKVFHDIPASSMLLTNYDPFYSPLLSRLDAVLQQLGLGPGNEICREKIICLMYSSPAKYAPFSNLISAQLSRELNQLRKPISDNPDILRFFKYMKAAKDGQDGTSCEINYKACTTLKESDGPAMITTYNDINKLVQARKLN